MGNHNRHRKPPPCRVRRGVAGTAVVAVTLAGLTASQAPGSPLAAPPPPGERGAEPVGGEWIPPGGPSSDVYHTELPPLRARWGAGTSPTAADVGSAGDTGDARGTEGAAGGAAGRAGGSGTGAVASQAGIPASVLAAYRNAERALRAADPGCRLSWELLAAIGKVESGHARGGRVDRRGTTHTPILGPVLNGNGFARITDTDGGAYDGDARFDRAVGPMQFIPSTWARWGADGDDDGRANPNNIHDAALAAGRYLCAGDRNLSVKADLDRAVLSYNHSSAYLRTVLSWLEFYRRGVSEVPDGKGVLPVSPGPGGKTPARRPVGGGGIVIGPAPSTPSAPGEAATPTPLPSPSASRSPSPAPVRPGPGGPGPAPTSPTTSPSPSPSPGPSSPAPSPSGPTPSPSGPSPTEPAPSPTDCVPEPPAPSDSPSPSPSATPSPSASPSPTDSAPPSGSPDPVPTPSASPSDPENTGPSPMADVVSASPEPCAPAAD
ncbi:lytic transglycosylase domain-containing protein [Streptomyces sp. O3]